MQLDEENLFSCYMKKFSFLQHFLKRIRVIDRKGKKDMIDVASNPLDAVERALNLFGNDILRLAYSYMKNRYDAEDIVQDVLIRYMQSAKVFQEEEHMKAWLLRVASNLCKDRLKSASYQREVAIIEAPTDDIQEESQVMKSVMALPEKYRSVIHLYYFEEYSTKEIAEILEKKETTIRSLLKRGREKLANMISQENKMKGDDGHAKEL